MDVLTQGALARIKAAVEGKPVGPVTYCEVVCGDVLTVAALIPIEGHSGSILALVKGCRANAPGEKAFMGAEELRHLIECVEKVPG